MMVFDIFNGDADGIFALHQYRLTHPCDEQHLVTGPKRDIKLLSQLEGNVGSKLAVFDISLASNKSSLEAPIKATHTTIYFHHHFAGDIQEWRFQVLSILMDENPPGLLNQKQATAAITRVRNVYDFRTAADFGELELGILCQDIH